MWPLDPWFEEWSRVGSSRRDNILANTHRLAVGRGSLRGPGATRRWPTNTALDPIMSDYNNVHPWHGCITYDGATHRYLATHSSIVSSIRDVAVCEYADQREGRPTQPRLSSITRNPDPLAGAKDRLYAFEGATGSVDLLPPAWSLMGVVLERHDPTNTGSYDVHIAFRGSQSGSAYRAGFQGLMLESGNADWVTDMEFWKTVKDRRFSPKGEIVLGLRDASVTSLGTIIHCLTDIGSRNGRPPTQVHITGHSLGGALAVQLAAAFAVGDFVSTLPIELREWPWASLALTTFSAPKSGDQEFATHFDSVLPSRRVFAEGDPITQVPAHAHVGEPVSLQSALMGTVNHEPSFVRRSMLDVIRAHEPDLEHNPRHDHAPWHDFDSLGSALLAAQDNGDTLADLFPGAIAYQDAFFVDLISTVIGSRTSYRFPYTKPSVELRRRSRRVQRLLSTPIDSFEALRTQLPKFSGVQPGSAVEDYLRRVLIVVHACRNGWTASDLLNDEAIAKVLGPPEPQGAWAWLMGTWQNVRNVRATR